ncbi:MAG TPA: zf-HC2 domain-containing protein [Blastocatellia bacterium]|nr:zf-HC2 domain-containing protein [Blastocatellia bacterium]
MENCERVEELIPLYAGGDLGESQARDVRAHAQSCVACGVRVAEYEASQAWLRDYDAPEFDEAFVDTVRAGVMRELAAGDARRPFVERLRQWLAPRRLAFATAALLVILTALALFIYLGRARVGHQSDLTARQPPAPSVEKQDGTPNPATATGAKATTRPKSRTPHRVAPTLANRSRHDAPRVKTPPGDALAVNQSGARPASPVDGSNAATQTEEKLRIEIQTADPNIRIIWFVPKAAEADAP